ncbi:hypothetical protein [Azospira inquinata]|uniref:Uncharacterized protein n=1 Tax=Azospira inquinata TaxID=2785627 RepID=A0A975SNG3_9RHOO|nr:hypothetical protein [Azospira inquinata]QWT45384.1 hypothetical protein J8L76_10570 [Azospira inquinata]QWT49286.1 hypothetical protein Azoinq_01310 [Azospira inquinata]
MLKKELAVIGEDIIVKKPDSPMNNKLGQILKVKIDAGLYRLSVSFEGEIYNFQLSDSILA